MTTEPNIFHL